MPEALLSVVGTNTKESWLQGFHGPGLEEIDEQINIM